MRTLEINKLPQTCNLRIQKQKDEGKEQAMKKTADE